MPPHIGEILGLTVVGSPLSLVISLHYAISKTDNAFYGGLPLDDVCQAISKQPATQFMLVYHLILWAELVQEAGDAILGSPKVVCQASRYCRRRFPQCGWYLFEIIGCSKARADDGCSGRFDKS